MFRVIGTLVRNLRLGYDQIGNVNFCSSICVSPEENLSRKTETYGQPHFATHPHLLKEGELTPGIKPDEYKTRRRKLLEIIQKMSAETHPSLKDHIVVIPSATKKYMSDKIPYVFRQNTDFLYLTGCLEPDSILLLTINAKQETKSMLFLRPKDKHAELWDGPRTGAENAVNFFGVDEGYDIETLKHILIKLINSQSNHLFWYDSAISEQRKLTAQLESINKSRMKSPNIFLHSIRLIKSAAEIKLMRKSCQIASESINETISETSVGDSEHNIFATVDYKCRMRHADYLAYPPVVASGKNATTIHYINNTQLIKDGDLVLMDAGCEYGGMTSDITRTWPVNRHFSDAQRTLYQMLLTVQIELIDNLLKRGGDTLDNLFHTMCLKLGKYLQEIGLIEKDLYGQSLARAAHSFCPHHVSHYLGMDVHDTPLISRASILKPGMVVTVEPGIYIDENRTDVPKEYRGMGLRIEDDILIKTETSIENLTESCIKNIDELET